jgi:hypothetical protein
MYPDKPDIGRAQFEAFKMTKDYAITRPEEIRLEEIAMDLGVYIREEQLAGAEARLLRSGNKGVITINAAIRHPGRRRFTIAHELGHWRLHDQILKVCSEQDLLGVSRQVIEAEANAFSASFLMPVKLLGPLCLHEQPDLGLICALAEQFTTTVTATALRFVDECRYPCTLVVSENGAVSWGRASKSGGRWIEPGWEVNPRSTAWEPQSGVSPRRRISPSLWFSDSAVLRGSALYEQSMPLGRYGIVLTLLSFEDKLESDGNDSQWSRAQGHSRMQHG